MIFKIFGVLQFILIQVISAQVSYRDLLRQDALDPLANIMPLVEYERSRRQINNSPIGFPGNGNLAPNAFAYGTPFKNSLPSGNFLRGNGLPNNFALNNGLPNNFALNNVLPNSSPRNFPFPNMNVMPQNRLLPSFNDVISNELPGVDNVPNGLPTPNNGFPGLNNVPNGLPSFNDVLPGISNVPNGSPFLNNGLPSSNNVPNMLPFLNNGLPGLDNVPNGLPSLNNGLPGFNNVPNSLPSLNNGWTSQGNVPNVLPGSSNLLNGLANLNKNPTFTNKVLNLNNVPVGSNILNLNNLPAANTLPNINNIANPIALPSYNNLPCNTLPLGNGLPINNSPSGNILPPINSQLPYFNNFRITEIGIGNGVADTKRFPRDNQPVDNMSPNANDLQNVNAMRQQVSDELTNMNNYQNNNGFLSVANMPSVDNRFSISNHFPISRGLSNIVDDVRSANNMQLNNGLLDDCHFKNYNAMPVNEQRFVNNFPANAGIPNTNSRIVNANDNGMPLSNGRHLNDMVLARRGIPETYSQNSDGSGFSSNDYQFGNIQVPVNNWHYDFVPSTMPANRNLLLSEGEQMLSNVPNDYSSVLTSNNLNLAQELVQNLKIEGLDNMPFLNGLPVAGITETVTVLNGPYSNNV